jgi:hypothetical protein
MSPGMWYLLPALALGFFLGTRVDHLRLGPDHETWIERTARCVETLERANDAKRRCISTLENVCWKLAEVEGAAVIQARLMHAEPYGRARPAVRSPIERRKIPEIMVVTRFDRDRDHDGT